MNPRILLAAAAGLFAAPALALSPGDQYNMDLLKSGSPPSIRNAAKNVHNTGDADLLVLDTMAEILANPSQQGETYLDAQAWICKALAATPQAGRYYTVVSEASKVNDKLQRHCGKAAEQIGGPKGEQYARGMAPPVGKSGPGAPPPPRSAGPAGGGSYQPITALQAGMSMDQAYAIAGPPTSTSGYVTGKAFVPFNFKGGDTHRTVAHYKGQGRVVFSNTSRYSGGMEISEIQIDPNSSGYQ